MTTHVRWFARAHLFACGVAVVADVPFVGPAGPPTCTGCARAVMRALEVFPSWTSQGGLGHVVRDGGDPTTLCGSSIPRGGLPALTSFDEINCSSCLKYIADVALGNLRMRDLVCGIRLGTDETECGEPLHKVPLATAKAEHVTCSTCVAAALQPRRPVADDGVVERPDIARRIVLVLNRAIGLDVAATRALLTLRVPCNEALANDPAIEVGDLSRDDVPGARAPGATKYDVSVLGLLNGIVGKPDDCGCADGRVGLHFDNAPGEPLGNLTGAAVVGAKKWVPGV